MDKAARIRAFSHIYAGHQIHLNHLEWFRSKYPDNRALAEKIEDIKRQSEILVELICAELRSDAEKGSAGLSRHISPCQTVQTQVLCPSVCIEKCPDRRHC